MSLIRPVNNKIMFYCLTVFNLLNLHKCFLMDLKMFLGNKLIDAVKINAYQLNVPGYVEVLKMEMEEKNEDVLDLSNEEPRFFIEPVPSSMNANNSASSNERTIRSILHNVAIPN